MTLLTLRAGFLATALASLMACGGSDSTEFGSGGAASGSTSDAATGATSGAGGQGATSTATTGAAGGGSSATTTSTGSSGCTPPSDPMQCGDCPLDTSLSMDVQPILTPTCAKTNCHKGGSAKAGLDLTDGATYGELVNTKTSQCSGGKTRVVPGDPAQSYLMAKLLGSGMCSGKKMPSSGSISAAEIQVISDWICRGAPND